MRLNRLDLTRYGRFTDQTLPFPPPQPGNPDLHVIYGPNEAGKSTFLQGWLDLLFQIPSQSGMSFLHPYNSMLLGAELEIDGQIHKVSRVKKRDHSLLDAHGTPIGEALIHGGLRGLNRSSYAAMFSLNRQTLDEGGESILASKGDLGELLFQASAGLTDLATQLSAMHTETEVFLRDRSKKGRLHDLKAEFDELGKQIKDLDTAAADFARLSRDRDQAHAAWQQARKDAEKAQTSVIETERLSAALPIARKLERLDRKIADFGDLPTPPAGWLDEMPNLDRTETSTSLLLGKAQEAVAELTEALGNAPPDHAILQLRDDIAAADSVKSAYDTALVDMPKRRKELEAENRSLQDSLSRLGQPNAKPEQLLPEISVPARLRSLVEQHSGIETGMVNARNEVEKARLAAENASLHLNDAGGSAADPGGLSGLVQSLRSSAPDEAMERAQRRLAEAKAQLKTSKAGLSPWTGDDTALATLQLPDSGTLDQLSSDIDEASNNAELASERLTEADETLTRLNCRNAALGGATPATIKDVADARAHRETEWRRHRTDLSDTTADQFESAMRMDDQITANLADQRTQVAKAAEAELALTEARQLLEKAKTRRNEVAARQLSLAALLSHLITTTSPSLPSDMGLNTFRRWLTRLSPALDALSQYNSAAQDLHLCQTAVTKAQKDLITTLAQAGRDLPTDASLTVLLETAQSLLNRTAEIATLRDTDAKARQEVQQRKRAMDQAEARKTAWQKDWAAACTDTWMANTPPGVAEMSAILEELDRLRLHQDRATDLTHRISAMQSNLNRFEQAVSSIAEKTGTPTKPPTLTIWSDLTQRQRHADARETKRSDLQTRLTKAEQHLADTGQKAEIHQTRVAEFIRFFAVTSWQDAREALTRAGALAALQATRLSDADDLCARMHSGSIGQARAQLAEVDEDALTARAAGLHHDLETLLTTQAEAHTAFQNARNAVEQVGGDDAVARLNAKRQTLLLEMEDGARQHLRRRLGLLAVDTALRRYRDTHRSGMLKSASEAFRIMSRDQYSGLATRPDGKREILVALTAEGGSKEPDQLSEGTRAQLYLALRIAGYDEFVRNNGPVPFIADDIMESFDDDRTDQAFGLLARMSGSGQVIYLTHHAHVCDIATTACPGVHIHNLETL